MKIALHHNLEERELAKALSGIVVNEGVVEEVIENLRKSDHTHEPIPEKYIQTIYDHMNSDYRSIMATLSRNVNKWLTNAQMSKSLLRKSTNPPILTEEQLNELRALIEAHFKLSVGLLWGTSSSLVRKWEKLGIQMPNERFDEWIRTAYVAGRIADILSEDTTYEEMKKLARTLTISREDHLILQAAQQNAAKYIKGYGRRLADIAEEVALTEHKAAINEVLQHYFKGDLTVTPNADPDTLTGAEVAKVKVTNWKRLSSELRTRFKAVDASRDWDRVAITEIRFATNMGRLINIQHEGGGDPEDIEVYFVVSPLACKYCKQLYLEPDGTPKVFTLQHILDNVAETGGMQIGLKASLIGQEGGWVPNATCHPNGHCYPVRKIKGYGFIPRGDLRNVQSPAERDAVFE